MTDTIGQQLRQAREQRNLTLEQAAQATHIRVHYLEALERGDLSRLPSKAQGRGFLRVYAGYLGLNPERY
jgi:cytoskeletal protein RodZ